MSANTTDTANNGTSLLRASSSPEYQIFEEISKPDLDDRSYRILTLPNKLDVLLISDPHTDKASAALDVHVGHLSDPEDVAGLAHFLEHLLFMGTKKYPEENSYSSFLSQHGGHSNAFTSVENTNYYFEVLSDHFEPALDRFAQFFIHPLFDESCTDREMNAVDSEHKKNLMSDYWRVWQLEKDLSGEHVWRKFGTGNLETLKNIPIEKGLDIRKILLDFHAKYYSANIMKLVLLGKESLEELAQMAIDKFSDVRNMDIDVPTFPGHPLGTTELQKEIRMKPVKELRHMTLTFPFPDTKKDYKIGTGRYLSHLIGHEGEGSLLSLLKKRGWALGLSAGPSRGATGFSFFKIDIDLTPSGIENYQSILLIVFQYIKMVQSSGFQEWIYTECARLNTMEFRFKEKGNPSSYASRLAGDMQIYEKRDVLSGAYLLERYDEEMIRSCCAYLRSDNFRFVVMSPGFNFDESDGWKKAQWYGTEYCVKDFDDKLKSDLQNVELSSELHLPTPNEFVPENFQVEKHTGEPLLGAKIIKETPLTRLWHKKDDTFWVPKATVYFQLKNPLGYMSPLACVLTRMYAEILKDALNEFSYYADLAGVSYSLDNTTEGLSLNVGGYNDKLPILLRKIAGKMQDLHIDPDRFHVLAEQVSRSFKNWKMESPHQHAMYYMSYLTQELLWTHEEKLAEMARVTPEMVAEFYPQFLGRLHIEGLVHGNVHESQALELVSILESSFKPSPLPIFQRTQAMRTHLLDASKNYIHIRNVPNEENVNSSIEYYLQVCEYTDRPARAALSLVAQIAQEPCFDTLRTKEQLGYMVFSGLRKTTGVLGYRVIIQSERDPAYLESRIESFLNSLEKILQEMEEAEFEKHKSALEKRILEKDKRLVEESHRLWGHVSSRCYDFWQQKSDAEMVSKLTVDEIRQFYKTHISPSTPTRRKLSVHIRSQVKGQPESPEAQAVLQNAVIASTQEEVAEMKAGWLLSRAPVMVRPLSDYLARPDVKQLESDGDSV
ncbi:Insulinase (Peptidase M16) [Gaertneriomyces sp. JEL0708]|nr:Insulinase (Peptidase M16) [Gaertneriomyces sp. JEL0708]